MVTSVTCAHKEHVFRPERPKQNQAQEKTRKKTRKTAEPAQQKATTNLHKYMETICQFDKKKSNKVKSIQEERASPKQHVHQTQTRARQTKTVPKNTRTAK